MRALRLSKSHWRWIFRASYAAFSWSTPAASFSVRLTAASSDNRAAAADWARNPPFNFSSRAAKSQTAPFSASNNASIFMTPKLLTIAPDLFQKFIQFLDDRHRPVHAHEQLLHILAFELRAFLIAPEILCLHPFERKLLGGAEQPAF